METENIETARARWADIAKVHGWYVEPFYVQVWLYPDGTVQDSVSFKGMAEDIIIRLTTKPDYVA